MGLSHFAYTLPPWKRYVTFERSFICDILVQQTLLKPPVNGLSPDEPLPEEVTGLDHSTTWRDRFETNRESLKTNLLIMHPLHQEMLLLWRKFGLDSIVSLENLR